MANLFHKIRGKWKPVGTGSPLEVLQQSNTSPAVIVKFSKIKSERQLAVATAIDDWTITLDDATGVVDGDAFSIVNKDGARFTLGYVVGAPAGNVVSIDRPMDFEFQIGDYVAIRTTNMAVDGSVTPEVFSIRGDISEEIPIEIDLTRIIFVALTPDAVDLSKFGHLAALTKGITLRHRNGILYNILNVKSNLDFEGITLDWKPYSAGVGNQGQDGFSCRLTFNGPDKLDTVVRLGPNEDLEIVIPENLSTITLFECRVEGSFVTE